jgi:hypothetical protein
MSLFFDKEWFEAKLEALGLTRVHLAACAGLQVEDIDAIYKDQREVRAAEVAAFSRLIGESPAEIAKRCGISTPAPTPEVAASQTRAAENGNRVSLGQSELAALHARIDRLERLLLDVLDRLGPPLP